MGGTLILVAFALFALATANGGCGAVLDDADGDFDFGVVDDEVDDVDGGGDLPTCDDVVVVEAGSGTAQVPGNSGLLDTSASAACQMRQGRGDEEAVVALQTALARCNSQTVAIDGVYGPATEQAVIAVQQRAGVGVDGEYGPATLQAMRWPTAAASEAECVAVSQVPVANEASPLPPTT
jgi:hypothetical protein